MDSVTELWRYRELFYFLAWRDVKMRYKQTALGVAWAVLQPLMTMVVFTLLFGKLGNMPSDGIPYPLFYFGALLPWTYFAATLGTFRQQPGRECESPDEGLLSASHPADVRGVQRTARLRHRVRAARRHHGLLSRLRQAWELLLWLPLMACCSSPWRS